MSILFEGECEKEATRRWPELEWTNDDPPSWMLSAQAARIEQVRRERLPAWELGANKVGPDDGPPYHELCGQRHWNACPMLWGGEPMRLTYSEALELWTRGLAGRPYRTGPGPYDYAVELTDAHA